FSEYELSGGIILKSDIDITEKILNKFKERQQARLNNDYQKSDQLRAELETDLNITIKDTSTETLVESNDTIN
ncbi:hypothetical protein CO044_02300, partial [Candidatus Peregrinibacteria bacterium CG_4_9_14_0_2_um_filter_38_9]